MERGWVVVLTFGTLASFIIAAAATATAPQHHSTTAPQYYNTTLIQHHITATLHQFQERVLSLKLY